MFPFVALQFYDGNDDEKDSITAFLAGSFTLWVLLNILFLSIIDWSYLGTFFGTKTAPQYTVDLYQETSEDYRKFAAIFSNRLSYTTSIHSDVKVWIANNIDRWEENRPAWYKVELIPSDFLPAAFLEAEGGGRRHRRLSNVSVKEVMGLGDCKSYLYRVHPE